MKRIKLTGFLKEEDTQTDNNEQLEKLAALEHEQWIYWAKDILDSETIDKGRADRWKALFITPYEELSEEMKEDDRKWARKVLDIVDKGK